MLRNKKHNTHEQWMAAWRQAHLEHDKERADQLISKAISRFPDGEAIYGWSGGKDALCLEIICNKAGIHKCVLGTIGEQWEFPEFWRYVLHNKPPECVIKNFEVSKQYMIDHPNLVFPQVARDAYMWYRECNQKAYYEYARDVGAKHILLGHRQSDGNQVRSAKNGKIYPISDFSHEDVFCILACYGVTLPAIYFYPNGFYHGTGAWIMHGGKNAMEEIYSVDKSLLLNNSDIPKIRDFLQYKENNKDIQA